MGHLDRTDTALAVIEVRDPEHRHTTPAEAQDSYYRESLLSWVASSVVAIAEHDGEVPAAVLMTELQMLATMVKALDHNIRAVGGRSLIDTDVHARLSRQLDWMGP